MHHNHDTTQGHESPFRKYRGQLVADLPCSYLRHLTEQDWFVVKFKDLFDQGRDMDIWRMGCIHVAGP